MDDGKAEEIFPLTNAGEVASEQACHSTHVAVTPSSQNLGPRKTINTTLK